MISTISWVPKGVCKPLPVVADPPSKETIDEILKSKDVLEESSKHSDDEIDDAVEDKGMDVDDSKDEEIANALAVAQALGKSSESTKSETKYDDIADGLKELDMDNYDDEDDEIELFTSGVGDLYYPSNDMDPYLKDKDDDDSEDEDETIKPTDAVIVCACNEDDVSVLQVRIYEGYGAGEPNLYIHHEIIIPAFPLCTAWLDCPLKGGERGNFIAVGSMEPSIEIWDLDIIDEVQPSVVLGGIAEKKKKKKGKKTIITYKENSHTDSVLGLAWNKEYRNILASASADKQVKIWDVSTGQCDINMQHHTDKVQAVAWNHHSPQVLLSGSFDHSVVLKDGRNPSHSGYKWLVTADVENLAWDPHTEHMFVVSLEDGTVKCFDIRNATTETSSESKASFTLHAHEKAVCSVSYNPLAPNLLATGSTDKMVKLWDLSNNEPSCVASTNPKAGAVFSVSFSEDCPFLLAIGGSKGKLEVWDTLSDAAVSRKFGNYRQPRS
ncbi:uncharacterized WD repeat-containing protein C17D11.16 [Momordica charantia]|uniref:Uncharacterized WD repeat-containing protein C17D11.16 n=1 Tax=Momordica charantia TaxID=3673 RepID=A0A6J1C2R2_MOMCH|nr:uncharacterized WD repeat-containing protein C17D11.16 [Momordica charantia]